jgi:diacylglycerol kinase (ATP)
MRALIVTNPTAGGSNDRLVDRIEKELAVLGHTDVCAPASRDEFNDEVLDAAADVDLVVVAGGDGTMNCTVNALQERLDDLVLGLIPMGTGNDLARTLDLPQDPVEAAAAIAEGKERAIDLGRASGAGSQSLFVNACIGGFSVEVDEAVDPDLKRRLGPLAFWVGGVKAAARFEASTVTVNGIEVPSCVAAGVGNGRTCGGGLEIWPRALPDDGVLHAAALAAANHAAAVRLGIKIKAGTHEELDEVRTLQGRRISISAEPEIEFNVDGELPGLKSPANFEIIGQIRLKVPARPTIKRR